MTALRQLRRLLGGRWFRRLLAVRLASQASDGVFQVALASYALFSTDQPSPAAVASALAVVLLPFSVLGPFAGVFLDRWARRQVLVWANLARVGLTLLVAAVVAAGSPDSLVYALVLVCLSVNRFLLAGLSAALPHTVVPADLVTANALTPTAGTAAFVAGLAAGAVLRGLSRAGGLEADVAVLAVAAALYAAAGLLALRIPRHLLGPDFDPARPAVRRAVGHVLSGLAAGVGHLRSRRPALLALLAIGAHRFWFGLWSMSVLLLPRGGSRPASSTDAAFTEVAVVAMVVGAGLVAAAVLTPWATTWVGPRTWVVVQLLVAAAAQLLSGAAGLGDEVTPFLVAAFVLGTAAQGIKICVDTLVQAGVDDAYRGRVFSLYDVGFNVVFVAAAAVGAVTLPPDGRSPWLTMVLAGGYLLTAMGYAALTSRARGRPPGGPPRRPPRRRPGMRPVRPPEARRWRSGGPG